MALADKKSGKKPVPKAPPVRTIVRTSYVSFQKAAAVVGLLVFVVVLWTGMQNGVSLGTIALRTLLLLSTLWIICIIVIKMMASYEEMNRGQS